MLPYVIVPPLSLGPFTVHPFGILVGLGITVGWRLAKYRGKQLGFDVAELESLLGWILAFGFVGAHLAENVFYHPAELAAEPLRIFVLWKGLSSFGGFIGAGLGAFAWKYYELKPRGGKGGLGKLRWPVPRVQPRPLLPFADLILSVFPVAWALGRMGCSIAHDHPGALAHGRPWLAVAYGPGPVQDYGFFQLRYGTTPRYDLGLLELLFTLVVALAFFLTWRHGKPRGYYIASICLLYAPARFVLDTLRALPADGGDIRYAGLTPAQWACLPLFAFGLWLTWSIGANAARVQATAARQA